MALKPIEIVINAKDKASGVFSSLQAKVAAVGVAIGAYFGVKSFVGVVEGAAQFEAALSKVQAATGASAAEMAKLKQAAQDAGANTKYTSTEAADALTNLGKAGLSAADAIETLPAVLNLAQAGGVELGAASEYITKAVAGMGLSFKDAARVADVLALGANATNTSVEGLAQALSYVAPVAQASGLSLEGTTAILGKLADAGIDASRSGTALSNMLSQFKDPASAFKVALADAGITTNNFEDALKQLAAAGPKGEKAILAVGLNAGPALRALLNQGMGALDELKLKLEGAAGSAAATAKVMQDNLAGSFKGLSSAWDTVKNVLGTPVLPVLKDAVDQLAGAFRSAVADGSVQKFGEAIATGFQAGIKWVREFLGTVDFAAVITKLQDFADSAKQRFDEFGQYATNAGNIVQTAYGVMAAGMNIVLVGIYGLGIAFSDMAARIVYSAAAMSDALSKIAFGEAKQRLIREAEEMRIAFIGLQGVSEEFGKKAAAAFDAAGQRAQDARNGLAGLAGATKEASDAGDKAALAFDDMGKRLEEVRQKDQAAAQAAEQHAAEIAKLEAEYARLKSEGNINDAIIVFDKLTKAQRGTADSSKEVAKAAAEAAAQITAAFSRLGVVSSAALEDQANTARRDYEAIRKAGTSTAEDVGNAFKAAADKAIAANKGVAPVWVEVEASMRGYRIETDAAGKSTLVLANAIDKAGGAHRRTAGAIGEHMTALEKLNAAREREIAAQEKANQLTERALELYRKKWNIDKDGFTLDANGQRMQQSVPNGNYIYDTAKGHGLSEEQALALMDKYFKNGQGVGTTKGSDWFSTVNKAIADAVIEAARQRAAAGPATNKNAQPADAATRSAPAPSGQASSMGGESSNSGGSTGVAVTRVIQLKLDNGRAFGVPTNGQGEDALQGFIQALSYAKSTSAQRHA